MDERQLGRGTALIALRSVAEREEDAAEAERREEARERREEVAARRAAELRRLGGALFREAALVLGWSALGLVALGVAGLALTYGRDGSDEIAAVLAALQLLWLPLAVSACAAWLFGLVYDLVEASRGRPPWSAPVLWVHPLMAVALPAILIGFSVEREYVSPWVWQAAPYASLAGFAVSLLGRLLWGLGEERRRRQRAQLAAVSICAVAGLASWLVSMREALPSDADQARMDRRLARHAPMGSCGPVPLESLPRGLLRDSLDGMVRCRQGGKLGKFYAFQGSTLLDLYASRRKSAVEARSDRHATGECRNSGGAFVGRWWKRSAPNRELGDLLCYGSGAGSTIEWSDSRGDGFASVRGYGRGRLYRWWREHELVPGF